MALGGARFDFERPVSVSDCHGVLSTSLGQLSDAVPPACDKPAGMAAAVDTYRPAPQRFQDHGQDYDMVVVVLVIQIETPLAGGSICRLCLPSAAG